MNVKVNFGATLSTPPNNVPVVDPTFNTIKFPAAPATFAVTTTFPLESFSALTFSNLLINATNWSASENSFVASLTVVT